MSHVVQIQTQVKDPVAVAAACRRLQLAEPQQRTVKLFSATVSGLAVELPGWRYPVVCDLAAGTLQYDHYAGRWGDESHLQQFLQAYAVEKTLAEARLAGQTATEQSLPDGSIRVQIQVAG